MVYACISYGMNGFRSNWFHLICSNNGVNRPKGGRLIRWFLTGVGLFLIAWLFYSLGKIFRRVNGVKILVFYNTFCNFKTNTGNLASSKQKILFWVAGTRKFCFGQLVHEMPIGAVRKIFAKFGLLRKKIEFLHKIFLFFRLYWRAKEAKNQQGELSPPPELVKWACYSLKLTSD